MCYTAFIWKAPGSPEWSNVPAPPDKRMHGGRLRCKGRQCASGPVAAADASQKEGASENALAKGGAVAKRAFEAMIR